MGSMVIWNLDDDIKRLLRIRAAEQGRSMEEKASRILRDALEGILPERSGGSCPGNEKYPGFRQLKGA